MKKIVVKIGSSIIAPGGKLDIALIGRIVKDIVSAQEEDIRIVLVSSGAIACGLNKLKFKKRPNDIQALMAISSVGQIILMDVFNTKFKKYNKSCAQILLTSEDFNDRESFINIRKTIDKLISMGAFPIINENDAVSHEEIGIGDNDYLSALVANLIGADQLLILSDVEGLLDESRVVKKVSKIDSTIKALIKSQNRMHTKGGMETKLEAATTANLSGIKVRIACGRKKNVITRIVKGEDIGTLFLAAKQIEKSRKRWINFSKPIKGSIVIDDGARDALLCKGKSLLNVGIISVNGSFNRGDTVAVFDHTQMLLGSGLINYPSDVFEQKKKVRLEKEVIHRDNFVKVAQGWCYHPYHRFSKKKKENR